MTDGVGQRTGARRYRAHQPLALAAIRYVPPIRGNVASGSDLLEEIIDDETVPEFLCVAPRRILRADNLTYSGV